MSPRSFLNLNGLFFKFQSGQTHKWDSWSLSEKKDDSPHLSSQSSPPFLKSNGGGAAFFKINLLAMKKPLLTPVVPCDSSCSAVVDSSSSLSSQSMARPEEPSHLSISSSSHGAPPSPTQPPHILPAAVRRPSRPPSSPSSPNGPLTTHVLTHLIEGFVIQEGLEPFPVISRISGTLKSPKMIANFRPDSTIPMST